MNKISKAILVGALTLSLAACGSDKDTSAVQDHDTTQSEVAENASITITDALGNVHQFDAPPASVATINPGDMDVLLALGANVVGRPTMSDELDPKIAAIAELGNAHEPVFESIAAANPEVLVVPPSFMQFATNIEAQGTEIIYTNADSIEDVQASITMFGTLFQKEAEASAINEEITTKIDDTKIDSEVNTLLVYGSPGTFLAALDNSLAGNILTTVGGKNIASDFVAMDKYPAYASLSVEKIIERNPQVIMLITHAEPDAVKAAFEKQMAESAGWKNLEAVKNNQIIILPADLFGQDPGTKIIESIDFMKEALTTVIK